MMIEVSENLFVGSEASLRSIPKNMDDWAIVHACKEPYHRKTLGYTGRAAPKSHPEYLVARRGDRLILNLIDADDPRYIPKQIIDAALAFIAEQLQTGKKVLVHCNQGQSRSPSIAFLYLAQTGILPPEPAEAAKQFKILYPPFSPAKGMLGFLYANWEDYVAP